MSTEQERVKSLVRAAGEVLQANVDGYLMPDAGTLQGCLAIDRLRVAWNAFVPTSVRLAVAPQVAKPHRSDAGWFSLVMNAAAAIEDAANCLRDPEAKQNAEGAAKHYRDAANSRWAAGAPAAPQVAQRLTRKQIEDIMTNHYPLDRLLRENVDAFEACVRDIERALGVGQQGGAA